MSIFPNRRSPGRAATRSPAPEGHRSPAALGRAARRCRPARCEETAAARAAFFRSPAAVGDAPARSRGSGEPLCAFSGGKGSSTRALAGAAVIAVIGHRRAPLFRKAAPRCAPRPQCAAPGETARPFRASDTARARRPIVFSRFALSRCEAGQSPSSPGETAEQPAARRFRRRRRCGAFEGSSHELAPWPRCGSSPRDWRARR